MNDENHLKDLDIDIDTCWICFEECTEDIPCNCSKRVHALCLAKWQIRNIGNPEEIICRFCNAELPDWKYILKPDYDQIKDTEVNLTCYIKNRCINIPIMHDTPKETFIEIITTAYDNPGIIDRFYYIGDIPSQNLHMVFKGIKYYDAILFFARVNQYEKPKLEPELPQKLEPKKYKFMHIIWKSIVRAIS
jgi:hypothetical protein